MTEPDGSTRQSDEPTESLSTAEPRAVDGEPVAATPAARQRQRSGGSGGSFWKELPFLVLIALVLALLIKTFLVQAFYIPSASMENTLQGGPPTPGGPTKGHPYDRVLVNKLVYRFHDPHRGDIVVFKKPPGWPNESTFTTPSNPVARFFHDVGSAIGIAPSGGTDFIKRVIGVGGDTVSCRDDQLYVNGKKLTESYLYPGSHPCSGNGFDGKSKVIPKGQLFVMGDHRDDSDDSRVPSNGPVPVKNVVGRAFLVIWPVSDWKHLGTPSSFKNAGVQGAGPTPVPLAGGALAVVPIALVRRRRRRSAYAAGDG